MAEDRCRAEHFARIRRRRLLEQQQGPAPSFNPPTPWTDVFREAARDAVHWSKQVRNKAFTFMANGGGKRSADAMSDADIPSHGSPGKRARSSANLKNELKNLRAQLKTGNTGGGYRGAGGSNGGGGSDIKQESGNHPKKDKQGRFMTTREGEQICFKFGMGKCQGVCPRGMKHVCQQCLAPHPLNKCKNIRK